MAGIISRRAWRLQLRFTRARACALAVACTLAVLAAALSAARAEGDDADADRLLLNPLAAIGADDLAGFRDRPLFSPSRRPPPAYEPPVEEPVEVVEPAWEPEPEPVAEPPNVALVGVVETGAGAFAVLRDLDAGAVHSLREGETIGSWQLEEIAADHVRFGDGATSHELRLFVPGAPGAPPGGPRGGPSTAPPGAGQGPDAGWDDFGDDASLNDTW